MEPWSLVSTLGLAYMYVISTGECPSWRSASAGRPIWCRRARGMHMERDVAVEPWRCIYTDLRRRKKARAPCVPGTDASSYAGFMNPKHQTRPEQTRISLVLRRMHLGHTKRSERRRRIRRENNQGFVEPSNTLRPRDISQYTIMNYLENY